MFGSYKAIAASMITAADLLLTRLNRFVKPNGNNFDALFGCLLMLIVNFSNAEYFLLYFCNAIKKFNFT